MTTQSAWLRSGAQMMLLALIAEQDRYGFEIIQEIKRRSDDIFDMKEGSLYPILHRLEVAGYLKSYQKQGSAGKPRKYYSITDKGSLQLKEDKETWELFSKSVGKVVDYELKTLFQG